MTPVSRSLVFAACAWALAGAAGAQAPSVPTPLSYEQALDLASSRNLQIQAARRARAIREAAVRSARQIPNPGLGIEVTEDTPHQIVNVGMPLEIGGKRGRRIDLAREELSLADIDVQAEARAVRRELRTAFYSLIAADERVRLAESVLDISRRVRDAAQARFDAGAAPRLEVLQANLGVTRAETDLELARGTRAAEQAAVNAVLDLPPEQALVLTGRLSDHVRAIAYDDALALAATSNVDLLALDRQMAVEQRRLDLIKAERVPTPVFSVSGLFHSNGEFTTGIGGGVTVTVPIFYRNQGEIAASVAATTQLRARRDATRRTIENDIYGTIARVEAERRQVEAYEQRLVPTATDLESLAEEAYRAGRTSVLALLDAQRNLRDLRRDALQAALDLQISLAQLEELLGTSIQ